MTPIEDGGPEAAEWDRRLLAWPGANLLQSYGWGEVQANAGWRTHRVVVDGSPVELPLTVLSAGAGLPGSRRLYLPRGPVCDVQDLETLARVRRTLVRLGRSLHAAVAEVEPPWEGALPDGHPWGRWPEVRSRQPLATAKVDLRDEPEQIMARFTSKTRYNVRLAERRGVTVEDGEVSQLLACLAATERRKGIHLPSRAHLDAVLSGLGRNAWVQTAVSEGEVLAAILVGAFGSEAVYLYGGATGRHRELMPNHLLHWRAMLRAKALGVERYDLWGIPETDDPRHPWHGLAQFKLGFGPDTVHYAGARALQLRPGGLATVRAADGVRGWARRALRR